MIDQNSGIVGSTTGFNYYVKVLSNINRELLKPSSSVALHRHSNALVDVLPPEADSSVSLVSQSEKPDVSYVVSLFYFNSCCIATPTLSLMFFYELISLTTSHMLFIIISSLLLFCIRWLTICST